MRRFSSMLLAGAIGLGLASGPALAEDSAWQKAQTRKVTFAYAQCVVRKNHEQARQAVISTVDNDALREKFQKVLDWRCFRFVTEGMGDTIRFPHASLQAALADALVNMDFAESGPASFDDRLPLVRSAGLTSVQQLQKLAEAKSPADRKEMEDSIARSKALVALSILGECIAREDPVNVRLWLLTRPAAPEEAMRIKTLGPVFAACLGDGTIKISRETMRGFVAINYYWLTQAAIVPGAGSKR